MAARSVTTPSWVTGAGGSVGGGGGVVEAGTTMGAWVVGADATVVAGGAVLSVGSTVVVGAAVVEGDVDAFGDDGDPLSRTVRLDPEPLQELRRFRPREERQLIGLAGHAFDHPGPEPDMGLGRQSKERLVVELAPRLQGFDHIVGIGGDAEADRQTARHGDLGPDQRPDVRHSQVQHVNRSGEAQDSSDATLDLRKVFPHLAWRGGRAQLVA